ncbi:unnamed protein product [Bursaphelenchus xylophilus]|uniref:Bifunctional lysine-specific demethylase and histidyl-hydroxylase NO66 n=1 Tax=Bursaphelenchus xylophilus TaxID=6326 RepID=A0A1I7RV68_BURXY|nr:unnamed protein product [Bursaphelenchus xylophilus]CAG9124665.1 unnamed protein product [Bursaphelenchus xylophilus]
MGRRFDQDLLALGRKQQEERRKQEIEKKKQWDNLEAYMPVYDLAKAKEKEAAEKAAPSKERKKKPLRNDGLNAKRVSLAEIKKAAKGFSTDPIKDLRKVQNGSNGVQNGDSEGKKKKKRNRKNKGKKEENGHQVQDKGDISGADVLGNGLSPIKRQKTKLVGRFIDSSGSETTPAAPGPSPARSDATDASFISLKDLKPGPVVRRRLNFDEDEDVSYEVQSPGDEGDVDMEAEDAEDEEFELDSEDESDLGLAAHVAQYFNRDAEEVDSDESGAEDEIFGYVDDLEGESDGLEGEDELDEEDLDFIDDEDFENELAEDGDFDDEGSAEFTDEENRIEEMDTDEEIERGLKSPNKDNGALQVNGKAIEKRKKRAVIEEDDEMEADNEYNSEEDSDFDEDDDGDDEELEDADPVDEDEINDILIDSTGDDPDFEDEFEDSDEEESFGFDEQVRKEFLSPHGVVNEPIGLTIVGFDVLEPGPTYVEVSRKRDYKWEAPKYELFGFNKADEHSVNASVKAFRWFVAPVNPQDFFQHIYAKRALVIHRNLRSFYADVFPATDFYKLFQDNFLEYGVNVNVAKYKNSVRTTHNGNGRVTAGRVVQHFSDGCSIQVVNPQSFNKNIHYICDQFQELFNCFVGANCYYTPKNTAGFAPHWDDIDAFLIQTEGRKHWKVYGPSDTDEIWPLESSHNFSKEEMEARKGTLVFDGWLETGDVLYMPRGYIHCATADKNQDSLHVTISLAQNFTYSELMKEAMDRLVEAQTLSIPQVRKNLPINLAEICGVADSNYDNEDQVEKKLIDPLEIYFEQHQMNVQAVVPSVVDSVIRTAIRRSLPPLLTPYEKQLSVFGSSGTIPKLTELNNNTEVRIIRKHTQRLLFQSDNEPFLVHRIHNSMVYEGRPETVIDVQPAWVPLIEVLLKSYPEWTAIKELGSDVEESKELCKFLFLEGILLVNNSVISKIPKMNVVVEKSKNIVGVLKRTQQILNESSSSEKKVSFSPEVKVKKYIKDTHKTQKIIIKKGKITKKEKGKKPKNGKRNKNKFRK